MAVKHLPVIIKKLISEGRKENEPIAIIQDATLITQKVLESNLGNINNDIQEYDKNIPYNLAFRILDNYYFTLSFHIYSFTHELKIAKFSFFRSTYHRFSTSELFSIHLFKITTKEATVRVFVRLFFLGARPLLLIDRFILL